MSCGEEDGRTALAQLHFVAEKKEIRFRKFWFFAGLHEAEDLRGGPVLQRHLIGGGGTDVGGMERRCNDGIAGRGPISRERKKRDAKFSLEWIGDGAEDGDVVSPVD